MEYNIYIKLTNSCNLKCKHCFNEIMQNHNFMNDDIVDKVIRWLCEFRKNHKDDFIRISLHGGEPMMYDTNKILKLLDNTKELNFEWSITTNLVYQLSEKHFQIFKKMSVFSDKPLILTSFDYGDLRFQTKNEKDLWETNVKKCINEEGIGVQPIICVSKYVVENVNPSDIFDYMKSLNIKLINFERITETGLAKENNIKPTNKEQNDWLYEAFLVYINQNDLYIPLFDGIIQSIGGIFIGCRARKCMENVITINPDGTIASCPNMADNNYGNINNIDSCKLRDLIEWEKQREIQCYLCEYYKYCNGDCCQLKFDDTECPGFKKIYQYLINCNNIDK